MNKPYKDSPIMGYLYKNASSDYMTEVGIPDPKIRDQWISNRVYTNRAEMDAIAESALMDVTNNPRINEIGSLLSH